MKKGKKRLRTVSCIPIDEIYKRFMFLPITIMVVSIIVIVVSYLEKVVELFPEDELRVENTAMEEEKPVLLDYKFYGRVEQKLEAGEKILDINKADVNDLMRLPAIGFTKAQRIVDQREKMGGFRTVEDIMCTDGIGQGVFEKIKGFITVK